MGKGRFLNQKLGKRMSRKVSLLKGQISIRKTSQAPSKPNSSPMNSLTRHNSSTAPLPPANPDFPENPVD